MNSSASIKRTLVLNLHSYIRPPRRLLFRVFDAYCLVLWGLVSSSVYLVSIFRCLVFGFWVLCFQFWVFRFRVLFSVAFCFYVLCFSFSRCLVVSYLGLGFGVIVYDTNTNQTDWQKHFFASVLRLSPV